MVLFYLLRVGFCFIYLLLFVIWNGIFFREILWIFFFVCGIFEFLNDYDMVWSVNCIVFNSRENREITDLIAPNQYGTPHFVLTNSHPPQVYGRQMSCIWPNITLLSVCHPFPKERKISCTPCTATYMGGAFSVKFLLKILVKVMLGYEYKKIYL